VSASSQGRSRGFFTRSRKRDFQFHRGSQGQSGAGYHEYSTWADIAREALASAHSALWTFPGKLHGSFQLIAFALSLVHGSTCLLDFARTNSIEMAEWSQDQQSASLNTHVCLESRHFGGGDPGKFRAQMSLTVLRATTRKWTPIPCVYTPSVHGLLVECGSEQLCPFDLECGKATAREVFVFQSWSTFHRQSHIKKEARHLCPLVQIMIGHYEGECGAYVVDLSLGCAWQRLP